MGSWETMEDLGLGLPSSSPSPSSPLSSPASAASVAHSTNVEAVNDEFGNLGLEEEKLGEKLADVDQEIKVAEMNVNFDKDSASSQEGKSGKLPYPLRRDEPDCSYYMKTGSCKYGMNCKFNHPPRKERIKAKSKKQSEPVQVPNEGQKENSLECSEQIECKKAAKEKKKEYFSGSVGKIECKYYSMPGGCKYGKACKYMHNREKAGVVSADLNFLGLPIRPGERECPYYMRTGSCKFASSCRFHHPDPTAVGKQDPFSGYQEGGSSEGHALPRQLPVASWPLQTTPNDPMPFAEASASYFSGIILPPQGIHQNPEWNGYQVPVIRSFPQEMNMQHSLSASTCDANGPIPQQEQVNEYPERPGQSECQYFMKTGSCKFKSACRFHHPRSRLQKPSGVVLSPVGLPIKPGQPVCTHYSRHRICKYGRDCKYDHPMNFGDSAFVGSVTECSQIKFPDSNGKPEEIKVAESSNASIQEAEW